MKQKLNFNAWLKDRDEALFSLDVEKMTAYSKKYGLPMPPDSLPNREKIILGGMAKAVLQIRAAPEEVKARARRILDRYGFTYDLYSVPECDDHTVSGLLEE